jgi:hypothetical protein
VCLRIHSIAQSGKTTIIIVIVFYNSNLSFYILLSYFSCFLCVNLVMLLPHTPGVDLQKILTQINRLFRETHMFLVPHTFSKFNKCHQTRNQTSLHLPGHINTDISLRQKKDKIGTVVLIHNSQFSNALWVVESDHAWLFVVAESLV